MIHKKTIKEMEEELLNCNVKIKKERVNGWKEYLPKWVFTHNLRLEIMDEGKHKGNVVVRSLQDRKKYFHFSVTCLEKDNSLEQLELFNANDYY